MKDIIHSEHIASAANVYFCVEQGYIKDETAQLRMSFAESLLIQAGPEVVRAVCSPGLDLMPSYLWATPEEQTSADRVVHHIISRWKGVTNFLEEGLSSNITMFGSSSSSFLPDLGERDRLRLLRDRAEVIHRILKTSDEPFTDFKKMKMKVALGNKLK